MCVCVHHIFFIHSSITGHLGCFHVVAIVNAAAVNMGLHISLQDMILFPLDKYPEVGLLNHMVVLFLILGGTSILFSIVAAPIYIPTDGAQEFPLSTSLPALVIFVFDDSHSNRCEVITHRGFDLHFPDD